MKVGTIRRILLAKFKLLKSDNDSNNNCKATWTNVSLLAATDTISLDLDKIYRLSQSELISIDARN